MIAFGSSTPGAISVDGFGKLSYYYSILIVWLLTLIFKKIDYKGFRLVASSLLPIGDHTLRYGKTP